MPLCKVQINAEVAFGPLMTAIAVRWSLPQPLLEARSNSDVQIDHQIWVQRQKTNQNI